MVIQADPIPTGRPRANSFDRRSAGPGRVSSDQNRNPRTKLVVVLHPHPGAPGAAGCGCSVVVDLQVSRLLAVESSLERARLRVRDRTRAAEDLDTGALTITKTGCRRAGGYERACERQRQRDALPGGEQRCLLPTPRLRCCRKRVAPTARRALSDEQGLVWPLKEGALEKRYVRGGVRRPTTCVSRRRSKRGELGRRDGVGAADDVELAHAAHLQRVQRRRVDRPRGARRCDDQSGAPRVV